MPLAPLLPLFHRLDREHFGGALAPAGGRLVDLRWSDGRMRRTAGLYRRGRRADGSDLCEIVLSRPLLEPLPQTAMLGTLCHEMIHAWIDRVLGVREVHGPCFRARMAEINQAQSDFEVSLRHHYPLPLQAVRWLARCPCCGVTAPYQRRVRGVACRLCCDRLHGGRWNASCQLIFEAGV
ncbi:SprT family zinc-dependent metalloprotease [Synechococcus sp. CS-602]|uniref:SprT family zinc-dependent metalloprotease n=1 Tax=Synechococcaceae TaxID=1890426 RepID=UPI0008FF3F3A|nr:MULTISPECIES: SprT family zinc-dependent metalloprotease [Synechococcaceae]MCT4365995.1 SprT family zinc-dependent metalloprotease [Candidatus Regnicoccus frigidus MAG-AL1]APD49327.1 sprT domain-containing protein [Synechococcus sp. SynAce01]MCT0201458.1 SprT family zinc-dependent metalloprotease [Synechococcus sp. CS-603]MCT0204772.1 SprT family zinc-dependent metalloprotease [Synechococcus sp. CS-602]MCT0247331.1 SprT family zinc-dependent metalloprotease [Synechococcus sp. CS-601]